MTIYEIQQVIYSSVESAWLNGMVIEPGLLQ
jgi:hypothetical protein